MEISTVGTSDGAVGLFVGLEIIPKMFVLILILTGSGIGNAIGCSDGLEDGAFVDGVAEGCEDDA